MSSLGELYWSVVEPHWDRISIYDGPEPFLREFERTPVRARNLFAAHWCISEVANGGFYQFFSNSTGVLAPEAAAGFEAIGLPGLASVVREAMAFFGATYPREREPREAELDAHGEGQDDDKGDAFTSLDDHFYELMQSEAGGFEVAADAYAGGSGAG